MEVPIWEKVLLTKEEACAYSNIGLNKMNEMMGDPMCSFVLHIGKRRLVKRKEFEKFIEKSLEV